MDRNVLVQEEFTVLAGVARWTKCHPENQRAEDLIPSQDICLGYGPGLQEGLQKGQPHIDVSLPFFLPLFLSL